MESEIGGKDEEREEVEGDEAEEEVEEEEEGCRWRVELEAFPFMDKFNGRDKSDSSSMFNSSNEHFFFPRDEAWIIFSLDLAFDLDS